MITVRTSTETGNVRNYQAEVTTLKNTITYLKSTLKCFKSRLDEAKKGSVNSKTWQWNSYSQRSKKQNKKDEVK